MTPTNPTSQAQSFDLGDFDDVFSGTLVLKNPLTGAPTPASIILAGPEHEVRKKIQMDRARKMRAGFQRTGKFEVTDPLDDVEDETDYFVACTLAWDGLALNGSALEYSAAAVRNLYTDPKRQWVRAQVRKALDEAERFIGSSAKA